MMVSVVICFIQTIFHHKQILNIKTITERIVHHETYNKNYIQHLPLIFGLLFIFFIMELTYPTCDMKELNFTFPKGFVNMSATFVLKRTDARHISFSRLNVLSHTNQMSDDCLPKSHLLVILVCLFTCILFLTDTWVAYIFLSLVLCHLLVLIFPLPRMFFFNLDMHSFWHVY